MEIHVIRHTPINFDKNRCYGRLEVPLAKSFREDAVSLKNEIDSDYNKVFSSPTSRCTLLAHALGFSKAETDERLLELDFGDWEGIPWDDINQDDLNRWMSDFVLQAPTNGETLASMFQRIANFINALRNQPADKVLIVTHAGVIRCIWAYFLEIPLQNTFKLPIGFGEVFKFKLGENKQFDAIKQLR